jgi:hypothetical protein
MQDKENTRLFVKRIFQKIVESESDDSSIDSDPKVVSAGKNEKEKLAVAKKAEVLSILAKITAVQKQIAGKQKLKQQISSADPAKRKEVEIEIKDLLRRLTELNLQKKASTAATGLAQAAAANIGKK